MYDEENTYEQRNEQPNQHVQREHIKQHIQYIMEIRVAVLHVEDENGVQQEAQVVVHVVISHRIHTIQVMHVVMHVVGHVIADIQRMEIHVRRIVQYVEQK